MPISVSDSVQYYQNRDYIASIWMNQIQSSILAGDWLSSSCVETVDSSKKIIFLFFE